VREVTGKPLGAGGPALELARRIVTQLRDVLRHEGRRAQLETCVDGPFGCELVESPGVAGLTGWDATVSVKQQMRSAGALQGLAGAGTLALFLPEDVQEPEAVTDALRWVWHQTDVIRVRLVRGEMLARTDLTG